MAFGILFGHTLHFAEFITCMGWNIAFGFEKPVEIYVMAGDALHVVKGAYSAVGA